MDTSRPPARLLFQRSPSTLPGEGAILLQIWGGEVASRVKLPRALPGRVQLTRVRAPAFPDLSPPSPARRQIHFSASDWFDLMHSIGRPVLDSLSRLQFEEVMVEQLRRYIWRRVNRHLVHEVRCRLAPLGARTGPPTSVVLLCCRISGRFDIP